MQSTNAGCFYCQQIFRASEVTEWVQDKQAKTALCPHCGINSVLPDNQVGVTPILLEEKHHYYFQ